MRFWDIELDEQKRCWQLAPSSNGDGACVAYHFFRSSFQKSLRAAVLRRGGIAVPPLTVESEEASNTTWHPQFGIASNGTTWLTYLQKVEGEKRVGSRFFDPSRPADYALEESDGQVEDCKNYVLQAGIGGWMTWRTLADGAPKTDDTGGFDVLETSDSVRRAVLASAIFEARYGNVDVALSYARSIVGDAARNIERKSNRLLSGNVKIDDIFISHEMKLALVWGRYRGVATVRQGVAVGPAELPLDTNYVEPSCCWSTRDASSTAWPTPRIASPLRSTPGPRPRDPRRARMPAATAGRVPLATSISSLAPPGSTMPPSTRTTTIASSSTCPAHRCQPPVFR